MTYDEFVQKTKEEILTGMEGWFFRAIEAASPLGKVQLIKYHERMKLEVFNPTTQMMVELAGRDAVSAEHLARSSKGGKNKPDPLSSMIKKAFAELGKKASGKAIQRWVEEHYNKTPSKSIISKIRRDSSQAASVESLPRDD